MHLRYGYLDGPAVCLCALLPQSRILNALIQGIQKLHDVPPCHDLVKVQLPGALQLVQNLSAQAFQHFRGVFRSGRKAGRKICRRAFLQCRIHSLVVNVYETLGARARRIGDRWRRNRGRRA